MGITQLGPTAVGQMLSDALITCKEILDVFDKVDLNDFKHYEKQATSSSIESFVASYLTGKPQHQRVPIEVFTKWLRDYLDDWYNIGVHSTPTVREALNNLVEPEDRQEYHIVTKLFDGLEALAAFILTDPNEDTEVRASQKFHLIAELLFESSHPRLAMLAADTARNIIAEPRSSQFLDSARLSFKASQAHGDSEETSLRQTLFAVALAHNVCRQRANTGEVSEESGSTFQLAPRVTYSLPRLQSEHEKNATRNSLNVVESAIRHLPNGRTRDQCRQMLAETMQHDTWLFQLGFYYNLSLPIGQDPDLLKVGTSQELNQIANVLSHMEATRWRELLDNLVPFVSGAELVRLLLDPKTAEEEDSAFTSWETFRFELHPLSRSVPFLDAIADYRNREDFLFTVYHELTHIYSMRGFLGLTILALRVAVLHIELMIWHLFSREGLPSDPIDLLTMGVAPLQDYDVQALALAEQSLEIVRKLQIVQDVWAPWLEGIAVFSELAEVEPGLKPGVPDAMNVLVNLFDLGSFEEEFDPLAAYGKTGDWASHTGEVRSMYVDAVSRIGKYRLKTYLAGTNYNHYLPGYLCVRSIVSAWRRKSKRPISGQVASTLLLLVTRTGNPSPIPDLALPIDAFRENTFDGLTGWLTSIASIPACDIERFCEWAQGHSEPSTHCSYKDGRILFTDPPFEGLWEEEFDFAYDVIRQALQSLTGDNADLDRVSNAQSTCRTTMLEASERLKRLTLDREYAEPLMQLHLRSTNILPLGSSDCPFWLNTSSRRLGCIFRTNERSGDDKANYRGIFIPLSDQEFRALLEQVDQLRETRMFLTRVADTLSQTEGGRGLGRQYFAFRYGDWCKVWPCGALPIEVSESVKSDIEFCLSSNALVQIDQEVIAKGHRSADRTIKWIEGATKWSIEGDAAAVDEWANHVRSLAEAVLQTESERGHVERARELLLSFVFGNEDLVANLLEHGLHAIAGEENDSLRGLVELLDESSKRPCTTSSPVGEGILFSKQRDGWDVSSPNGIT